MIGETGTRWGGRRRRGAIWPQQFHLEGDRIWPYRGFTRREPLKKIPVSGSSSGPIRPCGNRSKGSRRSFKSQTKATIQHSADLEMHPSVTRDGRAARKFPFVWTTRKRQWHYSSGVLLFHMQVCRPQSSTGFHVQFAFFEPTLDPNPLVFNQRIFNRVPAFKSLSSESRVLISLFCSEPELRCCD